MDTYKTIRKASPEVLYKDRKSKFFGYAYPITTEEEVKPIIEALQKQHHTANHVCYAWQLGTEKLRYRANDDGEPNNSAGMPIYGQILAFGLTNVLVAVPRIFGGTKLGVGGLIQAYRATAKLALEAAIIEERLVTVELTVDFGYPEMNKVMTLVKQYDLTIKSQKMDSKCQLVLSVRKTMANAVHEKMNRIPSISCKKHLG